MINYSENEHFDFNLELCLSEFFPIQRKKFETEIEIFQYLFDIEVACKQKFEIIFKNFEKISKKDKENAKYILYEKLMISFEQIKQAESIIEAINRSYNETDYIIEKTDITNILIAYEKNDKNVIQIFQHSLKEIVLGFEATIKSKYLNKYEDPIFFNIPKFLLRKYKKLIKKKFKNKLKRNNIVLTEFDITNDQSDILQLTNNLESILNNRNIVKNNQKLLDLIFIRNRSYFKSDPVAFDEFVNIFNDLLNWLNIEIVTEKNNLYNLNKYINKLRNDYLDIEDQEFITKTKEIISFYQSIDKKEIINIIFSLSLILSGIIQKKDTQFTFTNDLYPNSRLKAILSNTIQIFDQEVDSINLSNYIQSLVLNKYILPNNEILDYNLLIIKTILQQNSTSSINQITNMFFNPSNREDDDSSISHLLQTINLTPSNKETKSSNIVILISGFLSENENHDSEWENLTFSLNNSHTIYFYNWPGETLPNAIGNSLLKVATILPNVMEGIDQTINSLISSKPSDVFVKASKKAALSGKLLGIMLASKLFFPHQSITLIGFSLGVHVIKNCLKEMYKIHQKTELNCLDIIEDVILIAGATSVSKKVQKYKDIFNTIISRNIIQCYSKKDNVLNVLYRAAMFKEPVGVSPLKLDGLEKIKNCDFTSLELGHLDYRKKMDLVMSKIALL